MKFTNKRIPRQIAMKTNPRQPIPSLKKMLWVILRREYEDEKVWMRSLKAISS
jgi:hypothetical protein